MRLPPRQSIPCQCSGWTLKEATFRGRRTWDYPVGRMTAKVQRESRNFSDWGLLRGSTRMDTGLLLPFGTVAKPGKTTDFATQNATIRNAAFPISCACRRNEVFATLSCVQQDGRGKIRFNAEGTAIGIYLAKWALLGRGLRKLI